MESAWMYAGGDRLDGSPNDVLASGCGGTGAHRGGEPACAQRRGKRTHSAGLFRLLSSVRIRNVPIATAIRLRCFPRRLAGQQSHRLGSLVAD